MVSKAYTRSTSVTQRQPDTLLLNSRTRMPDLSKRGTFASDGGQQTEGTERNATSHMGKISTVATSMRSQHSWRM